MKEKKKYCYEYPRPSMTADCAIFGFDGDSLRILLIERGLEPFKGSWALPGGFMRMDETIDECARRELREETGIDDIYLEQCHVFSSPERDPRGRVVTVAFIALIRPSDYEVVVGDDAVRAEWFPVSELPPLAFDHQEIVAFARNYLKDALKLRPIAFRLLDEFFTMDGLRRVYEVINDTHYDRRNFERKAMQSNVIEEVMMDGMEAAAEFMGTMFQPRRGRPPRFFRSVEPDKVADDAEMTDTESRAPRGADDNDEEMGSLKDLFLF